MDVPQDSFRTVNITISLNETVYGYDLIVYSNNTYVSHAYESVLDNATKSIVVNNGSIRHAIVSSRGITGDVVKITYNLTDGGFRLEGTTYDVNGSKMSDFTQNESTTVLANLLTIESVETNYNNATVRLYLRSGVINSLNITIQSNLTIKRSNFSTLNNTIILENITGGINQTLGEIEFEVPTNPDKNYPLTAAIQSSENVTLQNGSVYYGGFSFYCGNITVNRNKTYTLVWGIHNYTTINNLTFKIDTNLTINHTGNYSSVNGTITYINLSNEMKVTTTNESNGSYSIIFKNIRNGKIVASEKRCSIIIETNCYDSDGDGYTAGVECASDNDCDDTNDRIYPGMTESCNSRDDDCDGTIDEGCGVSSSGGGGGGGGSSSSSSSSTSGSSTGSASASTGTAAFGSLLDRMGTEETKKQEVKEDTKPVKAKLEKPTQIRNTTITKPPAKKSNMIGHAIGLVVLLGVIGLAIFSYVRYKKKDI